MPLSTKLTLALLIICAFGGGLLYPWRSTSDDSELGSQGEGVIGELRDQLKSTKSELVTAKQRNDDLHRENAALLQSLKETQEELASLKADSTAMKAQLDALIAAKASDITQHNTKVESVVDLIAKLKAKGDIGAVLGGAELTDLVAKIKSLGEEGIKALNDMLNSEDPSDRILAAQLLMNFDDPSSIAPLESMAMEDADKMAKRWASQALLRMKSDGIEKTLRNLVENADDPAVKVNSLFGLCTEGNEWGLQNAISFIKDDDQSDALKNAFLGGILMLKSDGVAPIIDTLIEKYSDHSATMKAAIRFYKNLDTPLGIQRLQSMSVNGNLSAEIRSAALAALN
jgi:hypothetical protein